MSDFEVVPVGTMEKMKRMEGALEDAASYMRGEIQGSGQRDGILREIDALLVGDEVDGS